MRKLYVLRHGNTFDAGDVITRVGCGTDLPLSTSGIAQADRLADLFANTSFSRAYCSPLQRTRQTAESILKRKADAPACEVLEFLTEVDYGPDENKPEEDVIARLGQAAIDAWDADAIVPDGWIVDPDMFRTEWKNLLDGISGMDDGTNVLLVTSNGVARFLPDVVSAQPDDLKRKLKTGAFGIVEISKDGNAEITAWNQRP